MNLIESITTPSQGFTSSLNGRIVFDEGRGQIVVTEQNGQERSKMAIDGFTVTRTDNTRYGKLGQADSNGRDILAIADVDEDLRQEGI